MSPTVTTVLKQEYIRNLTCVIELPTYALALAERPIVLDRIVTEMLEKVAKTVRKLIQMRRVPTIHDVAETIIDFVKRDSVKDAILETLKRYGIEAKFVNDRLILTNLDRYIQLSIIAFTSAKLYIQQDLVRKFRNNPLVLELLFTLLTIVEGAKFTLEHLKSTFPNLDKHPECIIEVVALTSLTVLRDIYLLKYLSLVSNQEEVLRKVIEEDYEVEKRIALIAANPQICRR